MISRAPIEPGRVRKITGSFSWVDHRLLHDGHLAAMTPEEMLLYFFLVLVGDRNGVSFWSYDRICRLLKLPLERFIEARDRLVSKSLIAAKSGRFQVLQLPEKLPASGPRTTATAGKSGPQSLAEIFAEMAQRKK
ncbi:MAG: hypothetical protein ACE5NG_03570 [bacterium]